jgi:molybdopterin converting factor small subunit
MDVTVRLPTTLRRFAFNLDELTVQDVSTVGGAVSRLVEQYPRLQSRLVASDGRLFSYIGVFLNSHDIRHLQQEATPVQTGDTITLIPAMAGG